MDHDHKEQFSTSFPILPGVERGASPNKKMRNMKNLSVNTFASNRHGPQLPKLGLSSQSGASHASSAPPTPAFIVPPKMPRKKPSTLGLTITTPETASHAPTAPERRPSVVPQTPSDNQIRTLRALQTSDHGPLFSPTVAPEGGMKLPPFSTPIPSVRLASTRPPLTVSPQSSFDNSISSPITRQTLDHVQEEPDYDLPLSQEVKSPAYPQGPVCIYDPFVFLYLEPSDIEAREFDVVLNVAREVQNPFTAAAVNPEKGGVEGDKSQPRSANEHGTTVTGGQESPELQTPAFNDSSESANAVQADNSVATAFSTPKAPKPEPEYVHIPWDHNTNVVDDLLRLCELIDSRARQEKRVLIHCQCGVSRSASLVVAYGIYQNPQLTVQEAYDAVKKRSRWIGPNMNLIYQLSEFKTKLSKAHPTGTSAWHTWRNNTTPGHLESGSGLTPVLKSGLATTSRTPKTSLSVSSHLSHETSLSRANSFNPPGSAQMLQTSSKDAISPGPSSAPPDMQFPHGNEPSTVEEAPKLTDGGVIPGRLTPPRLTKAEPDLTLTLPLEVPEAIEQKEIGPAGAVAHDLQEVAKDLNSNDHTPAPTSSPMSTGSEAEATFHTPLASPSAMSIDLDEPVSPRTVIAPFKEADLAPKLTLPTSSPTLPAGFSRLLSRRQGPTHPTSLPLRQDPPRLVSVQPLERTIDPDVPPTPSLLSPRAAEFTASPFHRTVAGDLAGSSVFEQGLLSPQAQDEDPRSPAQRGEAPITRSIFDMI